MLDVSLLVCRLSCQFVSLSRRRRHFVCPFFVLLSVSICAVLCVILSRRPRRFVLSFCPLVCVDLCRPWCQFVPSYASFWWGHLCQFVLCFGAVVGVILCCRFAVLFVASMSRFFGVIVVVMSVAVIVVMPWFPWLRLRK